MTATTTTFSSAVVIHPAVDPSASASTSSATTVLTPTTTLGLSGKNFDDVVDASHIRKVSVLPWRPSLRLTTAGGGSTSGGGSLCKDDAASSRLSFDTFSLPSTAQVSSILGSTPMVPEHALVSRDHSQHKSGSSRAAASPDDDDASPPSAYVLGDSPTDSVAAPATASAAVSLMGALPSVEQLQGRDSSSVRSSLETTAEVGGGGGIIGSGMPVVAERNSAGECHPHQPKGLQGCLNGGDCSTMVMPTPGAPSPASSTSITPTTAAAATAAQHHPPQSSSNGAWIDDDEHSFATRCVAGYDGGTLFLKPTQDGEGGTYYLFDKTSGANVAVFKPASEEIGTRGNPHGHSDENDVRPGFAQATGYLRERLAYELDHGRFAGVPTTVLVSLGEHGIGSLQRFAAGMMQSWSSMPRPFDSRAIHRIAIFDLRTLNCDRHGGNLLVPAADPSQGMVPIDHAYCLPEGWADPDFEWSMWPQSKEPFGEEEREYVRQLDAAADASVVRAVLGEDAADVILATTALLKMAVPRGYTPREIAAFCRREQLTQPCGLETVLVECRDSLEHGGGLNDAALAARFDEAFPPR